MPSFDSFNSLEGLFGDIEDFLELFLEDLESLGV